MSEILKGNAAFEILPQVETNQISSGYYCMGLVLCPDIMDRRSQIISRLAEKGVGTSIYYPHPVPRMTYYRSQMRTLPDDFPVASSLSDSMIAIPVGPHIDKEDCDFIGKAVLSAIYEVSPG
jgi:dTDP-4-amino-4,6-dideoxygalactose transaminase